MTIEDFEILCYDLDVEPRFGYSGRGMYGSTCVGVVCDDPIEFAVRFGNELCERDLGDYSIEDWARVAVDQMGLQTIVYWPRINLQDEARTS